jgi:hypothetical protein
LREEEEEEENDDDNDNNNNVKVHYIQHGKQHYMYRIL